MTVTPSNELLQLHPEFHIQPQDAELISYLLQYSNKVPPSPETQKAAYILCLTPSDIVDVYIYSQIHPYSPIPAKSSPHHPRNLIKEEEIAFFYEVKGNIIDLTLKHILAATRAIIYEYLRWTPKDNLHITTHAKKMLHQLINLTLQPQGNKTKEEPITLQIIKTLGPSTIRNLLTQIKEIFTESNPAWVGITQQTLELLNALDTLLITPKGQTPYLNQVNSHLLLTHLTLLHSEFHNNGLGIETMLLPSYKHLSYILLISLNAVDKSLTFHTLTHYGSKKAKKLWFKGRYRLHITKDRPRTISSQKKEILFYSELLKDPVSYEDDTLIRTISKIQAEFPLLSFICQMFDLKYESTPPHSLIHPLASFTRKLLEAVKEANTTEPISLISYLISHNYQFPPILLPFLSHPNPYNPHQSVFQSLTLPAKEKILNSIHTFLTEDPNNREVLIFLLSLDPNNLPPDLSSLKPTRNPDPLWEEILTRLQT